MFVNVQRDTAHEHNRLFVAGIAYMLVVSMLVALAIAIYQKAFTPVTWVTVKADRAGLQLPPGEPAHGGIGDGRGHDRALSGSAGHRGRHIGPAEEQAHV